ncbi:MAG: hypothetical protein JWN25_3592, partial [Verrucomicrobiales bacterium]|nr:hypothetical protein [Verrucomicrobiales bacterium]
QQLSAVHEELTQAVGNSTAALAKLDKVADSETQIGEAIQNQSDARELLSLTSMAMKENSEALAKQAEEAPAKPQPSEKSPPSPGDAPSAAKSALKSLKSGKEGAQQAKSTLSKAARDQRMAKALKGSPSKSKQQQKTSVETQKSGTFLGEGGRGTGAVPGNNDKWADWSKLPEQIRKAYSAGELEMFSPEQRELIKNYFEKLETQP